MNDVFKTGDKVKCIRQVASLTLGHVYTVEYTTGRYTYLTDGPPGLWYTDRFELHTPKVTKLTVDVEADPVPTSRLNDPATSKGKRKVNKYEQAVLDLLNCEPHGPQNLGLTGKEMAIYTGHPLNCITPRFAPLRRKGLLKDSGMRRDKQTVWVLA